MTFTRDYAEDTETIARTTGPFGFRVSVTDREWAEGHRYLQPTEPTYTVYLPHQCDGWEIARCRDKEAARIALETFIAEAEEALDLLDQAP